MALTRSKDTSQKAASFVHLEHKNHELYKIIKSAARRANLDEMYYMLFTVIQVLGALCAVH